MSVCSPCSVVLEGRPGGFSPCSWDWWGGCGTVVVLQDGVSLVLRACLSFSIQRLSVRRSHAYKCKRARFQSRGALGCATRPGCVKRPSSGAGFVVMKPDRLVSSAQEGPPSRFRRCGGTVGGSSQSCGVPTSDALQLWDVEGAAPRMSSDGGMQKCQAFLSDRPWTGIISILLF